MEVNNLDELKKVVTSKILEKLDYNPEFKLNPKSALIIVPNIGLGYNEYIKYILKHYPDYELYLSSNATFVKTYYNKNNLVKHINFDLKDIDFINILDSIQTIFILGLKINQMKAISMTDDLDDINHIIIESAMINKSVNILLNANALIFNKILKTVKDIRNIGVNVINIQQNTLSKENIDELITESFVLNLRENGLKTLILNNNQIITPLAKDKLRELKIKVEYHKEEI